MWAKSAIVRGGLLALSIAACDVAPPPAARAPIAQPSEPAAPPPASKSSSETPTPRAETPRRPTRFPTAERIVALGDVHGDLNATLRALRLAGVVDEQGHWSGGKTVLVQTGDQLDRGDDEQAILDLFTALESEAQAAGGVVHVLNGNHELMNAAGDFRYVTPGGMNDFADAPGVSTADPSLAQVPEAMRARASAFLPGGAYARVLATRNTAVIVGDSVFVHGGVLPKYAARLDALNQAGRQWLSQGGAPPADLLANDGLVWTRAYSEPTPTEQACADLRTALATLEVERMVVGHTVQKTGITSACNDAVWRIDVGMAEHYGGSPAALEIRGDAVSILTE